MGSLWDRAVVSGITLMAGMVDTAGGGGGTSPSFTVTATPSTVSFSQGGLHPRVIGTIMAVKGAGGVGGFSLLWVLFSGSEIITPNSYTDYITSFSAVPENYGVFSSVWRLRVTDDSTGEQVFSNQVTLTLTATPPPGDFAVIP